MATSSKMPSIYIALGAVAVLGGLYYMQTKKDASNTNTAFTQGSKSAPPQIKVVPEEIDRVTLKAKDKPEVVLEKKPEGWAMVSPVAGAKIQKSAVDDVLNGLKGLTFKETIAQGQPNFAAYDLDEGKGIHVIAAKAGAPVVDLWLGAQKSRGQMARLGNDPSGQIWSVAGVSAFTFDKGPKDVRDKKVWDLPKENVTYVEVKSAKGTFSFSKNEVAAAGDAGAAPAPPTGGDAGAAKGDASAPAAAPTWLGMKDGKPLVGLEVAKVDDLVNAFALGGVLNADDFGDGKSDVETGLASPEATTFTFRTKEGTTQKIVLGKSEGTKRYARKEGDSTIFLLAEGPSGWAEANDAKFVPPPPATADGGTGDAKPAATDAKK